ncbi:hypothetical protein ACHAXS_005174 [Conticribra weissflogii]
MANVTVIVDPNHNFRTLSTNVQSNVQLGQQFLLQDLCFTDVKIDNDNDSIIKNAGPPLEGNQLNVEWVTPTLCPRRASNVTNSAGSWKDKSWTAIADMDKSALFWMTFPKKYFWEVLILQTNKSLKGEDLSLSEFYIWLGINLLMGCYGCFSDQCYWWSSNPIHKFGGAPFCNTKWMLFKQFDAINAAMRFTDDDSPGFEDKFHKVSKMIKLFNDHYS